MQLKYSGFRAKIVGGDIIGHHSGRREPKGGGAKSGVEQPQRAQNTLS